MLELKLKNDKLEISIRRLEILKLRANAPLR